MHIVKGIVFSALVGSNAFAQNASISEGWSSGLFFGARVGTSLKMKTYGTQMAFTEEIGFHFSRTHDGPFVALELSQSFVKGFIFGFMPRGGYDVTVYDKKHQLVVSSGLGLGFNTVSPSADAIAPRAEDSPDAISPYAVFGLQAAVDLKLYLDKGNWAVVFRPVGISALIGSPTGVRYDMTAGFVYHL